jgi:HKD family nuclease
MELQFISSDEVSSTLRRLMQAHSHYYWAVAWGSDNSALAELIRQRSKIVKLVIGTHFYQTPPGFLANLEEMDEVRVVPPDSGAGTFHPKTYLFVSVDCSAALVGSANFTNAAMESNVEACCLVEGKSNDAFFRHVRKFIEDRCWSQAERIDEDFLRSYRIQHDATKQARADLRKFRPLRRPLPAARRGDPVEMDWPTYLEKVRHDSYFDERLQVLAKARSILGSSPTFSTLAKVERKAIAGILVRNEPGPDNLDWGMFGSMVGFGIFKNIINDSPEEISDSMDCIPPTGTVTRNDFDRFVKHFKRAFEGKSRTGGVPSASRLLALKRPDYFVCFDERNKKGLSSHFGVAASSLTLDNYWPTLIEPIILSPWWRTPRPRGPAGQVWDGRAAFLDSLYYEEP